MKTVIMNLSGNTGKSTLARHMLAPLLNARLCTIEDVNQGDGTVDVEISAKQFNELASELNIADDDENFVIDIGASNAKYMLEKFAELALTTELIDCWLIPVTPHSKQNIDSIRTAIALVNCGVPHKKIVLFANNVSDVDTFENDYKPMLLLRETKPSERFVICSEAVLSSDVYEILKEDPRTIFDIAKNKPDFSALKKQLRAANDMEGLKNLGEEMVLFDMCRVATKNVQTVFNAIPQFSKIGETLLNGENNG